MPGYNDKRMLCGLGLKGRLGAILLTSLVVLLSGCEALMPMEDVDEEPGAYNDGSQTGSTQAGQSDLNVQQAKASLAFSKSRNIESTLFIDNMRASVSLQATVNALSPPGGAKRDDALLKEGYRFQFRSINKEEVSIGNVIIQADGQTVVVEPGSALIPSGQGYTMLVDLNNSRRVNPYKNATLTFDYQGRSVNVILREHQLVDVFETAMR